MNNAKPFVKWAGGKRQLLDKFKEIYPKLLVNNKIDKYFEPFLGGGAVFFDIYNNYKINEAYLYDINEELILAYKVIQKEVFNLIELLRKIETQYKKLNEEKRELYYYELRDSFNLSRFNIDYSNYSENWKFRAAQIIFLNKTCYNGLFRFNSLGKFNTPIGSYKNPIICDDENLIEVSKALMCANIKIADFSEIINDIKRDSFIYYDPPYRPISKTSNFTSYTKNTFLDNDQIKLANIYKDLNKKNILQMLSNSDPKNIDKDDDFFDIIYKDFNIYRIPAKRFINSDANKRFEINEIIVTNY